ncbi:MAG: DsrE family protein [Proteobacteria bacterium]|nr:DsrE family protein [Pseudomonadota bacterium]
MKEHFSDEHLNAYLDNQLDREERIRIMEALPHDAELASRLCKLQKVQEMVQLAYHNVEAEKEPDNTRDVARNFWPAVAASMLLVTGLVTGWLANNHLAQPTTLVDLSKSIQAGNQLAANQQEWRLMLHVSSGDNKRFAILLDETEQLLKTSARENRAVQIEILTNGAGLKLLEQKDRPHIQKLQKLARQYNNLSLIACQTAMKRYKAEKGIDIQLIPEAGTVPSAMHEVIKRQEEGWSYINI